MTRSTRIRRSLALCTALVLAGSALAACGSDDADTSAGQESDPGGSVAVEDPWARTGTTGGNSAVYMELVGGDEAASLTGVSVPTDVAASAEIHETVTEGGHDDHEDDGDMGDGDMDDDGESSMGPGETAAGLHEGHDHSEDDEGGSDGMMSMQPVDSIDVPAGATVALEPGGYHVMLLDLAGDLVAGDTVELTLTFGDGSTQDVAAEVRES